MHSIDPIAGMMVVLAATANSAILLPAKLPKVNRIVPATALLVMVRPVNTTLVLVVGVQMASVVVASNL